VSCKVRMTRNAARVRSTARHEVPATGRTTLCWDAPGGKSAYWQANPAGPSRDMPLESFYGWALKPYLRPVPGTGISAFSSTSSQVPPDPCSTTRGSGHCDFGGRRPRPLLTDTASTRRWSPSRRAIRLHDEPWIGGLNRRTTCTCSPTHERRNFATTRGRVLLAGVPPISSPIDDNAPSVSVCTRTTSNPSTTIRRRVIVSGPLRTPWARRRFEGYAERIHSFTSPGPHTQGGCGRAGFPRRVTRLDGPPRMLILARSAVKPECGFSRGRKASAPIPSHEGAKRLSHGSNVETRAARRSQPGR